MLPPTTNWLNSSAIHVKDGIVPNVMRRSRSLRVSASSASPRLRVKNEVHITGLGASETEQRRSFPRQSRFRAVMFTFVPVSESLDLTSRGSQASTSKRR